MCRSFSSRSSALALVLIALTTTASAQSLGTFTWQLQPYCNVVSVNVTGVAGVYTLEGFDDQCGAGTRAPLTGVATPNPDGTIGFGMNLVTSPGGRGVQLEARISTSSLSGPWTDSDGNSGRFAFNQRAAGSPRPLPASGPVIPPAIGLQPDGGFVAVGAAGVGTIPASGAGTRMMWHPNKSAFRAGHVTSTQWDDTEIGQSSVAFGFDTTARGGFSAAFGDGSVASGQASIAFGSSTASGLRSVAFGNKTKATGPQSAAFGTESEANGDRSFAVGLRARADGFTSMAFGQDLIVKSQNAIAIGDHIVVDGQSGVAIGSRLDVAGPGSIVMGSNASTTQAARGSFVFSDNSSGGGTLQSFTPHQFLVRAVGGTTFYSNILLTAGVRLAGGANAWSSLSDVNSKEHFRDLDSRDLLGKLARMSIREWSYKSQDASIRHVGPTAQDFHAAFGLGEDPLRISTIDADGIALAGVSALARENAELTARLAALEARLEQLGTQRR